MNLIKCYQTNSTWYKQALRNGNPVGILWHDTAGGNPTLKRYVQPFATDANYETLMSLLGKNKYGNDWNHIEHEAGLNAWIGQLADGTIATVQAGEWDIHAWGCGGGGNGSCNGYIKTNGKTTWTKDFWIQFEICDDGYGDEEYFKVAYREACEFTAYICKLFNIDPNGTVLYNGIKVPTILCHADSYKLGMGCNHGDIYSWFKKYGYDMTNVRKDVAVILQSGSPEPTQKETVTWVPEIGDVVNIKSGVTTYYNGVKMASWVPKATLYIRGVNTNETIVISTLKEGAITGTVFANDLVLVKKAVQEIVETVTEPEQPIIVKDPVDGTPSTGSDADAKVIWDFLMSKINNEYGVAGLMGNLYAESGLRSNNMQNSYEKKLGYSDQTYTAAVDNGTYNNFVNDAVGYGLAQWTYYSRKQNLINYTGSKKKSIGDFETQLAFLYQELTGNKAVMGVLTTATSVLEASNAVLFKFEAPSDQSESVQSKRAGYGQKYFDIFHIAESTAPSVDKNIAEPKETSIDEPTEPATNLTETNTDTEPEAPQDMVTPTGDGETSDGESKHDTYIKTPEEAQNFLMKILNVIIGFVMRLFNKK